MNENENLQYNTNKIGKNIIKPNAIAGTQIKLNNFVFQKLEF